MASLADFTGNGRSDRSPKTVFLAGHKRRGRGARLEDALHDYIGLANALGNPSCADASGKVLEKSWITVACR